MRRLPIAGSRALARARRVLALACLLALLACNRSCSCSDEFLAKLESYQGEVQRDEAKTVGSWSGVANGERFQMGDGLRTGKRGTAQLVLAGDGVALVEPKTVLRFLDRDPRGKSRFELEQGAVRFDPGSFELDVHTPRALAKISRGSSVRIRSNGEQEQFDVLVGTVAIDQDGQLSTLSAGQQLQLAAAPRRQDPAPEEPFPTTEPVEVVPPKPVPTPHAEPSGPQRAELSLPEIESMTLHAPSLPVTFRLQPPECRTERNERSGADMDGRAATPDPSGNGVLLQLSRPGTHRINLRCDRRLVRQTTLHVVRDAATMELPKSAQRVDIEADGRRYTVRYQNVIPVLNMRWSGADAGRAYTLVLKRGQREQTYKLSKPTYDLPGFELVEGNYEFWFTGASGHKSSVGGLRIEFDNTARALSLSEPTEGAAANGDFVTVSGVALLRSQVSANGTPLPLDSKGRFRAQVPLSPERNVLVRASHPAAGVHYYLRRLR